jgi:hypothetical protein
VYRTKVVEEEIVPAGERLLSGEDQGSLITDSMSVTSADQEKLLLLNRNTELRRVNKEVTHKTTPQLTIGIKPETSVPHSVNTKYFGRGQNG